MLHSVQMNHRCTNNKDDSHEVLHERHRGVHIVSFYLYKVHEQTKLPLRIWQWMATLEKRTSVVVEGGTGRASGMWRTSYTLMGLVFKQVHTLCENSPGSFEGLL